MARVVLISAYHDYRSAKRASIHQVARGLGRAGHDVTFVSTRFSRLSKLTGDSRLPLWDRANRFETLDNVRCLLWRTSLHPFRSRFRMLNGLNARLYPRYAELPNRLLDELVAAADYVIVESGPAAIYLGRLRRMNATAKIIYYAADRLDAIGTHPFIQQALFENRSTIDHYILRSSLMKGDFPWAGGQLYVVGFAIDEDDYSNVGPSPFEGSGQTAVSVGSMLFDPEFFQIAAPLFPSMQFHVIGAVTNFRAPSNVIIHQEMPFGRTLAYLKHATIGIAAYRETEGVEYLADTSLKIAQFEYFGRATVCPWFAAGSAPHRIAYKPGDAGSIKAAIGTALGRAGQVAPRAFPNWQQVALQVIEPQTHGAPQA